VVIDEAQRAGGQIYRRQPENFTRSPKKLYGFDASKAVAVHDAFDQVRARIDYRPNTLAWTVREGRLYTVSDGYAEIHPFDALILATGATDRLAPIRGWTLPGCYTLGGAQIAVKAQACSIGRSVVFLGTGPLLYLVAYQYAKAGADVRGVLDTAPLATQIRATPAMFSRPGFLLRGLYFRGQLMANRVPIHNGCTALEILGETGVGGVRFRLATGAAKVIAADAVGMGFHLRSETQLADLAGCTFAYDGLTGQWCPVCDEDGRTDKPGVYVAGDGGRILGADAAETAGRLAALAVAQDFGLAVDAGVASALRRRMKVFERFRAGMLHAFPWPAALARETPDDVLICRCEAITAGELRRAGLDKSAPELNRAKALCRVGMGRCQGRYCGSAAAEVLAGALNESLEAVGRVRGQAPVKPLAMTVARGAHQ
jgi:NADPH-dependent 2,4-dienoyl-CoA reductase/sulfur reductase-like enzyme